MAQTDANSGTVPASRQPPVPADDTVGLTGKAAQKALQQHILESGTSDVQKIARLRRASLQPDSPGPSAKQSGPVDPAAMMALAMAEVDEDEDEGEGGVASSDTISVTFTQPGSLGLKFSPNKQTGSVDVVGINPGTQAERHPELRPGLSLVTVGSTSVVGMPYRQVIETIKVQGRPVRCEFGGAGAGGPVSVTFTEAGSLGLVLSPNGSGQVAIAEIKPGSQAHRRAPQLVSGLILQTVAGTTTSGKTHGQVVALIKAAGRPLTLVFTPAAPTPSGSRSRSSSPSLQPPPRPPQSTAGTVAVTFEGPGALGLSLIENATDKVVIESISGGMAASMPQLQVGLVLSTYMPANASARRSVDNMTYREVLGMLKGATRPLQLEFEPGAQQMSTAVTFTESGPLGLKFTPNVETGTVEVLAINPGTQAEKHPSLTAGLVLRSIGTTSVTGTSYDGVLKLIKAGGRPLRLEFGPGGTVAEREAKRKEPLTVTFTEAGSLGLKFTPNKEHGTVEVLAINPGGQAERHQRFAAYLQQAREGRGELGDAQR